MKPAIIIAALSISLFTITDAFAQDTFVQDGIYAAGTEHSYKTLKAEPIYWINAANEFVVYVPYKQPIVLMLKEQSGIKTNEFPEFSRVVVSDYSFMLCTADKKAYYFTTEGYEQKQTLDLLKNFGYEIITVFYGNKFASHPANDISVEKLKEAKSVYDVLGKR